MTEDEVAAIITAEWTAWNNRGNSFKVMYVLPNESVPLPPLSLPQTHAGELNLSEVMLINRACSPEIKLFAFYHELGHLIYNWTRLTRPSCSDWQDEFFAYHYSLKRLIDEGRFNIARVEMDRLEAAPNKEPPAVYRQAIEALIKCDEWEKWKRLCAPAATA